MTSRGVTWDVVGIGANSVDYVNLLPGYPQPFGSFAKMRIRKQMILCGGQMATAMATCASLGLRAKYVGVTGTDDNGRRIRQELAGRSIDVSDVIIRDGSNQFAVILVDETTGDRIVLWDRDDQLMMRDRELPSEAIARRGSCTWTTWIRRRRSGRRASPANAAPSSRATSTGSPTRPAI